MNFSLDDSKVLSIPASIIAGEKRVTLSTVTRIGWKGFADAELEQEYRLGAIRYDQKRARGITIILMLAFGLLVVTDYRLLGFTYPFAPLLAMRTALVLMGAMTLLVVRRGIPAQSDRMMLVLTMASVAGILYAYTTRPVSWSGHAAQTMGLLFAFYFAFPVPWYQQLIPAAALSVGYLAIISMRPTVDALSTVSNIATFLVVNTVGMYASAELDRWKRLQFVTMRTQTRLHNELELAMAENRTLHGIIPICAHCKRIRDEGGRWQAVESYVRDHTRAEFSHGLCQSCVIEHYPEFEPVGA